MILIIAFMLNGTINRDDESSKYLLVGLYFGGIALGVIIMTISNAKLTEKGNALKCLFQLIDWAANMRLPEFLYYHDPEVIGKFSVDLTKQQLETRVNEISTILQRKNDPNKKTEKQPNPKQEKKDETKQNQDYVFVYKMPLAQPRAGWDDQAKIYRPFSHVYIYCPIADFSKHFPQQQTIEAPFQMKLFASFITHSHADVGSSACLKWTNNPITGESEPHLLITDSVFITQAKLKASELSDVDEKIIVASYIEYIATQALGLKTDLEVAEQQVNDLLGRRQKTAKDHANRERDADHDDEGTIFTEESEVKRSYWKYFLGFGLIALLIAFITKLVGVW